MIGIWASTRNTKKRFIEKTNINTIIIVLVIFTIISFYIKQVSADAYNLSLFEDLVAYKNLIMPWMMFILIVTVIDDEKDCVKLIQNLSLLLIASVVIVILKSMFGFDIGPEQFEKIEKGRFAGFSEENQYAAFIALILPRYFPLVFINRGIIKKIGDILYLLMGFFGMISTVSKGGFISLGISIGYFLKTSVKEGFLRKSTVIFAIPLISILVVSSFFFVSPDTRKTARTRLTIDEQKYKNKWEEQFIKKQSWAWRLTTGRTDIWGETIEYIKKKPIWGYGFNADATKLNISTHNDPMKWVLNFGIVGFILFTLLYIKIFKFVYFHYQSSKNVDSRSLYLGYLCGFIGYTVAMFGVNMFEPRLIFWIYTGLIYSYIKLRSFDNIVNDNIKQE